MSFSKITLQTSRHYDQHTHSPQIAKKRMGLPRVIFTAFAISFAGFMYFVAMHYVPELSSPRKILRFATETKTIPVNTNDFELDDPTVFQKLLGPYYNSLFARDRSYMRSGEEIQIKYDVPLTATLQLDIVQCERFLVVEIFNCTVLTDLKIEKKPGRGIATFKLGSEGFYHFRHKVVGLTETDTYRIIWERI